MPLSSATKSILASLTVPLAASFVMAPPHPAHATDAPAIPAQPEGWTMETAAHGIVLSSPPDDRNNIVLFVIEKTSPRPAGTPLAPPAAMTAAAERFVALTESSVMRLGKLTWRQGVTLEDTLLRDAVTIEDFEGNTIHGYAFAYTTPNGLQTLSVFWPAPLTAQSEPVAQALDHVAALWRVHFAYDGSTTEIAPLAAPTPPITAANAPSTR